MTSDNEARKVLTIGTFDVPHLGHAYLFQECARLGEVTVGVNTNMFVERYKGSTPVYFETQRMEFIEQLGYRCRLNDGPGHQLIESEKPDYLVIGSDWATRDYYKQIGIDQYYLDQNRITMVYVPRIPLLSTSEIKERMG